MCTIVLVVRAVVLVVECVTSEFGVERGELGTFIPGCKGTAGEGMGSGVTKILQSCKRLVSSAIARMKGRIEYEESLITSSWHIELNAAAMSNTGLVR